MDVFAVRFGRYGYGAYLKFDCEFMEKISRMYKKRPFIQRPFTYDNRLICLYYELKRVDFNSFFDFFHIVTEFFVCFHQVVNGLTSVNNG